MSKLIPTTVEALAALAWPLLTGLVIWKLWPYLLEVVKSRAMAIRVGTFELSVQESSDELRKTDEDLQRTVEDLRGTVEKLCAQVDPHSEILKPKSQYEAPTERLVAWVDDSPKNNAYEITRLQSEGTDVLMIKSTEEAVRVLVDQERPVWAVVSDMTRLESGTYNREAGIDLIRKLRSASVLVPIYVYTSAQTIQRIKNKVTEAGGNGITASRVELFKFLNQP